MEHLPQRRFVLTGKKTDAFWKAQFPPTEGLTRPFPGRANQLMASAANTVITVAPTKAA